MAGAHSGDCANKLCSRQHCCGFNGGMSVTEYLVEDIFADFSLAQPRALMYTQVCGILKPLWNPGPALWAGS